MWGFVHWVHGAAVDHCLAAACPTRGALITLCCRCPAPGALQVPLGSVTPLALAQPGAAGVVLLLDSKLQGLARIGVHPLDNRTTTVLSAAGLETFLRCVFEECVGKVLGTPCLAEHA